MAVPVINAIINFSTGPSFAQAMILDQGILDTSILADSAAVIVDVSNQINNLINTALMLPEYLETKEFLAVHLDKYKEIIDKMQELNYKALIEFETDYFSKVDLSEMLKKLKLLITGDLYSLDEKLRLLCISTFKFVEFKAEIRELWELVATGNEKKSNYISNIYSNLIDLDIDINELSRSVESNEDLFSYHLYIPRLTQIIKVITFS